MNRKIDRLYFDALDWIAWYCIGLIWIVSFCTGSYCIVSCDIVG
jgi:hypothetical protein